MYFTLKNDFIITFIICPAYTMGEGNVTETITPDDIQKDWINDRLNFILSKKSFARF